MTLDAARRSSAEAKVMTVIATSHSVVAHSSRRRASICNNVLLPIRAQFFSYVCIARAGWDATTCIMSERQCSILHLSLEAFETETTNDRRKPVFFDL